MSENACRRRSAEPGPAVILHGLIVAGLLAGVSGCRGGHGSKAESAGGLAIIAEPMADEASAAPPDFSVDLLVLAGSRRPAAGRVEAGPIRLLLSPDGGVYAAPSPDAGGRSIAERVRTVDRVELGRLWTDLTGLGWLDPALAAPPVEPELVEPGPEELVAVVSVTGQGRRRSILARAGAGDELPEDVAGFIRRVAALAWIDERSTRPGVVIPRRYDLGPDPHERYRRGAGAADASDGR